MTTYTQDQPATEVESNEKKPWAALALMGMVFVPVVIGWWLPHVFASREWLWIHSKTRSHVAVVVVVLLACGGAIAGIHLVKNSVSTDFGILAAGLVASVWLCSAPLALVAWNVRKGQIANDVAAQVFEPARVDAVEKAIFHGSIRGLNLDKETRYPFARDGERHRRSVMGVAVQLDRRSLVRKFHTAPRSTLAQKTRQRLSRLSGSRPDFSECSSWITGKHVVLPEPASSAIVLGGTGSGKTVLTCGMVAASIRQYGSVVYFNGKGDRETRDYLKTIAESQGVEFRHWTAAGGAPFDGWKGTFDDIISKLVKLLGEPSSDAAAYYLSITETVLQALATRRQATGVEPWGSSREFLDDLNDGRGLGQSGATLERVRMDMHRALAGIDTSISGRHAADGWCWEDTERPSITLVDVPPHVMSAQKAATLMLCDLVGYKEARRAPDAVALTVIIDEAQVLLNSTVIPPLDVLIEQVRAAGIGIVLATQSVAGLGTDAMPQRLLDSGVTIIAGYMVSGEEIANRAGTRTQSETGHQGIEGSPTGVTTSRAQHGFKVSPQRLRELPTGCFYLITKSHDPRMFKALPPASFTAAALSPLLQNR